MGTGTMTETFPTPNGLSSSVSSLSSTNDTSRFIARTYRQAQQLFITRRLQEALDTLEQLITPPQASHEGINGHTEDSPTSQAPIVDATRAARVKVWNLYIAIINQIAELSAEEGKAIFGAQWKALVAKAQDGSVWTQVIRDGYKGQAGAVDTDVVANLSTLLLTHSTSQKLNQSLLETYLSSSAPSLHSVADGTTTPGGTSTPRELQSRLRLLEIYTLHILPANGAWDQARQYVNESTILDDERKDAFLAELQALQDDRGDTTRKAEEEAAAAAAAAAAAERQRQLDAAAARKAAEDEQARQRQAKTHARQTSEVDYGIDRPPKPAMTPSNSAKTTKQPQNSSSAAAAKRPRRAPPSLFARAASSVTALQTALQHGASTLGRNPAALLRVLFMLLAMLALLARQDVRGRVNRAVQKAWEKLRQTVGMGLKVSYV